MVNLVIPAYNCSETLPKTLSSLMAQTKSQFITTIVDDNSKEDLSGIIKTFSDFLSIQYIKLPENRGPGHARQVGVDSVPMCDYVMFLDSDDLLYPRAVEILYREAKRSSADIIYSDILHESRGDGERVLDLGENTTWLHGKIYRMDFLRKFDIRFPEEFLLNEDSYYNLVCYFLSENRKNIPEVTYIWRNNPKSITRTKSEETLVKIKEDYVYLQVQAIEKILSFKQEVDLGATISNMYAWDLSGGYCQRNTEAIARLFKNENFTNLLNHDKIKGQIAKELKGGTIVDGHPIIFDLSFKDWCKSYGYKG